VKVVRPEGLAETPYAYAAIAPEGGLIFTAGACPLDAVGNVIAPGDYEAQAGLVLDNLFATLAAANSDPKLVLKTTVYVVASDRSELVRVWDVVATRFGSATPASTLLGVAMLGYPDQLVEIEAIAVSASG
jgi:enamine deaminase RidA (YjgF/YER057c/UK114 family)